MIMISLLTVEMQRMIFNSYFDLMAV